MSLRLRYKRRPGRPPIPFLNVSMLTVGTWKEPRRREGLVPDPSIRAVTPKTNHSRHFTRTPGKRQQERRRGWRCLTAIFVLVMIALAPSGAGASNAGIFGAVETYHPGLTPFPKWTGAMERYFRTKAKDRGPCHATMFNRCLYRAWMKLLDELKNRPPEYQLGKINYYMNRHRYITDIINWGVLDYWAAPAQFFRKDGDCEDYAIAKYFSLRALGWDADKLRIVVLQDLNLRVAHAILAVYLGDKIMLLDNQISIVVDSKQVRHYSPFYAVNENGWWRLRPRTR